MAAPKMKSQSSGAQAGADPVKRIAPYPIPARIFKVEGQPPLPANILKLTDFGFIMSVDETQFYKVGEEYTVSFELPVVGNSVRSAIKVIKTYDSMEVQTTGAKKTRMIEMHFKDLSTSDRSNLNSYLVKSGQKKI